MKRRRSRGRRGCGRDEGAPAASASRHGVAASGVGVGVGVVVVAVAVLVAGESGRHQTEHAAQRPEAVSGARSSSPSAVARLSTYATASAGGVATHGVSCHCVLAYSFTRRRREPRRPRRPRG